MIVDSDVIEQIARRTAELVAGRDPMRFLDAQAAAELLGVPATWLLAEARADRVPHHRFGKYVRFRPTDLEAWQTGHAHGPRSARSAA